MKKILPFDADIKMNGFPHYGDFIGIMKGHGYNEFITGFNLIPIRYYPFLKSIEHSTLALFILRHKFEAKPIKKIPSDIISFIRENIDQGYYLTIKFTVDIPNTYHNNLIIGYDDETQMIQFAGYRGSYKVWSISYDLLVRSLPSKMDGVYGPDIFKNTWYAFHFSGDYRQKKISKWKMQRILFRYAYGSTPYRYNTTAIRDFAKNTLMKNKLDLQCTKKIEEHMYGILEIMQAIDSNCDETTSFLALYKKVQAIMVRLTVKRVAKNHNGLEVQGRALIEISYEERRILKQFCRNLIKRR